jgi:hypothetical protein
MKSALRIVILSLLVIGIAGGLIRGFVAGRQEQAEDAEREAPVKVASHLTSEDGRAILFFDDDAQKANGIRTTVLVSTRERLQGQATGVVLQLQPLLDLKASYNTPRTDLIRAKASARASEDEYQRLQELNRDGKNASDKAVDAARANAENDAALVANAERTITVLNGGVLLRWGPVVAKWIEGDSPEFDTLLTQRRFLLQVTSTTGGPFVAPKQATVQLGDGTRAQANLVSVVPQLDPRLQVPSLLYAIAAHPGLVPGVNLSVFLPTGSLESGVIIPSTAVVWSQGSAWCYVESSPGKFARTAVETSNPLAGGWFVARGFEPSARVVITGAQTLLSEEFRSQIQADKD